MMRFLAAAALFVVVLPALWADAPVVQVDGGRYALLPKRTPPAFDLGFTITPCPKSPKGVVRFLFGYQDAKDAYRVTLSPEGYRLEKLVKGAVTRLNSTKTTAPLKPPFRVLIKRRPLLLTLVVNGRVVAESFDTTYAAGKIAIEVTSGTPKVSHPSVQKYAPIHVADDFMVEVDESVVQETTEKRTTAVAAVDEKYLRDWKVVSGAWQLHSVMEDVLQIDDPLLAGRIAASQKKPDALRSANPFSMESKSKGRGIAVIGYPFWDDYTAAVSVNSRGSEFGLVFYFRSRKDYFLLRWRCTSVREKPRPIELVRVSPEGTKVLAHAYAPCKINQWYRLRVQTFGRHARAYLDGAVLFDAFDDRMVGGKVGLYSRGEGGTHFDDVKIDSTDSFPVDTAALLRMMTVFAPGAWQITSPPRLGGGLKALKSAPEPTEFAPTFSIPMRLSTSIAVPSRKASAGKSIGVRFGTASRSVTFEWAEKADGRSAVQRVRYHNGGSEKVLCEASAALLSGKTHKVDLDLTEPPLAKAYVDGRLELCVPLNSAVAGRFSFLGNNIAGARFADVQVYAEPPEDHERQASNVVFADDPYMVHWSAPQGAWVPAGSMRQFWHKGDFLGRFSVTLPFEDGIELLFCTSRTKPGSDLSAPLEP